MGCARPYGGKGVGRGEAEIVVAMEFDGEIGAAAQARYRVMG